MILWIKKYTFSVFLLLVISLEIKAESIAETNCVCGNGIQEILPQSVSTCPYKLYGIAHDGPVFGPTSPASLYYFNTFEGTGARLDTVVTTNPGQFGTMVGITSLDFSPQGILYAAGRVGSNWGLATINCETAQATVIGTFNIGAGA